MEEQIHDEPPSIPTKRQSVQMIEFQSCTGEVKQSDVERVRAIVSENAHVAMSNVGVSNTCTMKSMDRPCKGICLN